MRPFGRTRPDGSRTKIRGHHPVRETGCTPCRPGRRASGWRAKMRYARTAVRTARLEAVGVIEAMTTAAVTTAAVTTAAVTTAAVTRPALLREGRAFARQRCWVLLAAATIGCGGEDVTTLTSQN